MDENDASPKWRQILAVLLVVMALSVVGVAFLGSSTSRILSTVGSAVGGPGEGAVVVPNDPTGGEGSESGGGQPDGNGAGPGDIVALQDAARPDLLIIRTGTITVEVADLDAALDGAGAAISALGGYESGSERSGRGEGASASVVYRFPAATWEDALAAIRGIGNGVRDEHSETTDVSSEVVDIEARIRNLRVTEAAFQSIMDRAAAIDDVLSVQAELSGVRSEIEQLTAKSGHLREQAAMSTLTVSFVLPEAPVVARQEARFDPGRETEAATARLVELLQALATAGIWFGIVWLPVLVAIAVLLAVGYVVSRRLRAKVAVS